MEDCYSDLRPVTSRVLHGLVLCPLLVVIYINDLDDDVINVLSKFVDCTKIGDVLGKCTEKDDLRSQHDLDGLGKRAKKWKPHCILLG